MPQRRLYGDCPPSPPFDGGLMTVSLFASVPGIPPVPPALGLPSPATLAEQDSANAAVRSPERIRPKTRERETFFMTKQPGAKRTGEEGSKPAASV
jgi:hypothetical protein